MSLDYSSICNLGSRGVDKGNLHVMGVERYILTSRINDVPGRNKVKLNFNNSEEETKSIDYSVFGLLMV